MSNSINNEIPFVPENTIDPAAGLNEAINVIDAKLQLRVLSIGDNAPPGGPAEGDRHIVGTAPTGAWTGQANKLARWLDGAWTFHTAYVAVLSATVYVFTGSVWVPATPATRPVVTLAGDTYTLADLTPGAWHIFTSAMQVEITVEPDSGIPDLAEYGLEARGTGGVLLVEDSSSTIFPPKDGTLELEPSDFALLKRTDDDEYKLVGGTALAS